MRKIKFRAWNGMAMEHRVVVGGLGAFYVEGLDPKDSACLSPFNTKYSDQTPVMQFTGLLDKNGKEIYEGDVVKGFRPIKDRSGRVTGEERFIGAVEYDSWWGAFRRNGVKQYQGISAELMFGKELEVIGNIYEHSSLLEG